MRIHLKVLALATVAFAGIAPASAATTVYTSRASFAAVAGDTMVETFNSFRGQNDFRTTPINLGAFSLAGFGNQGDRNRIDPAPTFAFASINGTALVNAFTAGVGATQFAGGPGGFEIRFNAPIRAFGADFAGFGGAGATQILAGGNTLSFPAQGLFDKGFFGFTSDTAFSTIRFQGVAGQGDGFFFDNATFSTPSVVAAVPEPASWALMIAGFGLVGGAVRRRRKVVTRVSYAA